MAEPGRGVHEILDADQAETAGRRFVNQGLGLGGIDFAVTEQGEIDVMDADGAVTEAGDAAEERLVLGRARQRGRPGTAVWRSHDFGQLGVAGRSRLVVK
jgi:hypothetical protein